MTIKVSYCSSNVCFACFVPFKLLFEYVYSAFLYFQFLIQVWTLIQNDAVCWELKSLQEKDKFTESVFLAINFCPAKRDVRLRDDSPEFSPYSYWYVLDLTDS